MRRVNKKLLELLSKNPSKYPVKKLIPYLTLLSRRKIAMNNPQQAAMY
jgi:hypothetical protein